MGSRKYSAAEARKEARKSVAMASLNNCPTSPRKMRLVADLIRGMAVEKALFVLKYSPKEYSIRLEKLLLSALSNWQTKNPDARLEDSNLVVESVMVDGGRMLKGPGDGMSDNIPATIAGKQPARLADGEFVVPADVVSHLGNGSTDAGAKQLYAMMNRVRKARTGNPKQGKQIKPAKYMTA
jgi:large subunit ribosomal protein L22